MRRRLCVPEHGAAARLMHRCEPIRARLRVERELRVDLFVGIAEGPGLRRDLEWMWLAGRRRTLGRLGTRATQGVGGAVGLRVQMVS